MATPAETSNSLPSEALRTADNPAGNAANPFDLAGKVHDELFSSYFSEYHSNQSVSGIAADVEALTLANRNFLVLDGANVPRFTADRLQAWTGHESCAVTDAITNSTLSNTAKISLISFTNSLLSMNSSASDYDAFYAFIENYESGVLLDPQLTGAEKERLLTIASICRYSAYRNKKKPKKNTDPDWDMMILSLAGSIDGSERNAAESVVDALTAGIFQNK